MIAKEKAKELVDKMYSTAFPDTAAKPISLGYEFERSKQCALIAVEEILKAIPMYTGNINPTWKFYDEVKEEIQAL